MTATGSTGWDNDARRDRVRVGFAMASLMCLPVVVCNLGVEMLYILEQRLRAQSVPEEKAVKVLHDVVTAMFDPAFVDELFKPQPAYTQRSMRRIMDKLAHSSIMRLSESSMDKLYDLVTMGLKYQLVTCREPEEILTVTLFHLATLKSYLTDPKVMSMIDAVEAELRVTYAGFPKAGWHALRQTLFRFLADKQIKVSLFLQENLQNDDGRVKLPAPIVSARALGPVGTVTRHDEPSARERRRASTFASTSSPPRPIACRRAETCTRRRRGGAPARSPPPPPCPDETRRATAAEVAAPLRASRPASRDRRRRRRRRRRLRRRGGGADGQRRSRRGDGARRARGFDSERGSRGRVQAHSFRGRRRRRGRRERGRGWVRRWEVARDRVQGGRREPGVGSDGGCGASRLTRPRPETSPPPDDDEDDLLALMDGA